MKVASLLFRISKLMTIGMPITFLCVSSYFKGNDFLRSMKATGATVYLVTSKNLEDKPWAKDSLDDIFYVQQGPENEWNMPDVINCLAWLMRSTKIDRIVALDDFDVEKAAHLREHFRIPGMGETTCRHFRDKLAMRMKAKEHGIEVPAFSSLFNDHDISTFISTVPSPWIIKPRGQASATGMKKIYHESELWPHLESLGSERHQYLIEQFKPGDVYHADALTINGEVIFCRISKYLSTPFDVAHGGGIFRSITVPFGEDEDISLQKLNKQVMDAFGLQYSASHTEFIKSKDDGKYYFLETASRVGGAHIAEMVEYSSGVNLWREWARIEYAVASDQSYSLPSIQMNHAGIIVSLTRQEWPDDQVFTDFEIVWRMREKSHHIGLIVQSSNRERVLQLLDDYANRIGNDFHASAPAPDKPTA